MFAIATDIEWRPVKPHIPEKKEGNENVTSGRFFQSVHAWF
jgi:transposase